MLQDWILCLLLVQLGAAGTQGTDGAVGAPGLTGTAGTAGAVGAPGAAGTAGTAGAARAAGNCGLADSDKVDCGEMGIDQGGCEAKGCCWQPVAAASAVGHHLNTSLHSGGVPWCYYPGGSTGGCDQLNWEAPAEGPGFPSDFYQLMFDNFRANLNVEGSGAVVAAPDRDMGYYYHWMRDGGLCIKTWLEINDNNYNAVRTELEAYVGWVAKVQQKADPNGIDVRVEPKFTIPDGEPYTGGWCRPQTDGPALRALALAKWGRLVLATGQPGTDNIWQLVSNDLDWVKANWGSSGCDLWEEVQSEDFFFNRMAYIYSLHEAASFAEELDKPDEAATLLATADTIRDATLGHFRDGFLYESTNRPYDGAVIHAVVTFGEYLFPPHSDEAAATVQVLAKAFCQEYPLNQAASAEGRPGVLIGRYPGDTYQGGNPWQLLTAVLAELFYAAGQATFEQGPPDRVLEPLELPAWRALLHFDGEVGLTAKQLGRAQVAAGDAVMARLYELVKSDGGRVDEQMDKVSGGQVSAKGLTWSYANILHALHTRQALAKYL